MSLPDPRAALEEVTADRYRIERELGQGGMATVYLARDLKHDRDVALKVLKPELAVILGRERFLNEIRLTARLDHPHILTLIDSGETGGFFWYVTPFIRGESLRARLNREKQLGVDEALGITRHIAGALVAGLSAALADRYRIERDATRVAARHNIATRFGSPGPFAARLLPGQKRRCHIEVAKRRSAEQRRQSRVAQ